MNMTETVAGARLSGRNRKILSSQVRRFDGAPSIAVLPSHPEPGRFTLVNTGNLKRFHAIRPLTRAEAGEILDESSNFEAASDNAKLWENYSKIYPLLTQAPAYREMTGTIASIMSKHLPNSDPARVLGLGSGTGAVEIGLIEEMGLGRFSLMRMVELSAHMQDQARNIFSNLFGNEQRFRYTNSSIVDIQSENENSQGYVEANFDGIVSSLVLPFIDRSRISKTLTEIHGFAKQEAPIIHVVHKDTFNPKAIALGYLKDLTIGNKRGSLINGSQELLNLQPTIKVLGTITKTIANNQQELTLFPENDWIEIFNASGMAVEGDPLEIYSGQALLFFGRRA